MNKPSLLLLAAAFALAAVEASCAVKPATPSVLNLKGDEAAAQVLAAYDKAIATLAPNLAKADGAPLRDFEAVLHYAARPGAEAERAACCKAIAAALRSEAPPEAKTWMLKLVAFADRGEVLPEAVRLLGDNNPLLRESARYALQHTPVGEAAQALRAALQKAADPAWQGALALALGARQDAASVPAIAALLAQKNGPAVDAALSALGNIADAQAARALAGALKTVPESLRIAAAESYMKCAEQMLAAGQNSNAANIYRDLLASPQPRAVRLAALDGQLKAAGEDAAGQVLSSLADEDADTRAIAAGFIPELPGSALKKLASGMSRLSVPTQVMVLGALADRGEKSALPEAQAAAGSADPALKLAGLTALGRLGDVSTVPLLIETLQAGGGPAGPARESLQRIEGAGVNEALIAAMRKEGDAGRRAELIALLESRGVAAAVPALLGDLAADQPAVRRAAMRALGKLASPAELPAMVQALVKSPAGAEREEGERALAAVCTRVPDTDKQAEPILAACARGSIQDKAILVPLLGRLGGAKALEQVKAALADNDPALQKAGETALMNWPDADEGVEKELVSLAERSQKPAERTAALRAYIRVIAMPSGLPEKTRLAKFQKAMALAGRDEERRFVLERAVEIKHIETLRFVASHLDNPALCARAGSTICDLARERGLRDRNKAEFQAALNKVVQLCKDQSVVDRAKRRLQEQ